MSENPHIQAFLEKQSALKSFLCDLLLIKPAKSDIYLVGGCVRDLLSGQTEQKDVDLMIDNADENTVKNTLKLLKRQKTISAWQKVGRSFPVFKLLIPEMRIEVDFALARKESTTGIGHRDFIFTTEKISAAEDAKRRDFTVNALFCRMYMENNKLKHEILDFFDGLTDLQQRLLRCVGDTKARFSEDPLRMLRAIRFARKGFRLHNDITEHIQKLAPELLPAISMERIHDEFLKAMQANLRDTHNDYLRFNLYQICFPDITPLLPESPDELPDIEQPPEKEMIFAIMLAPFLIRRSFQPGDDFFRQLEKKLNDLRAPNPGKIRSALSTLCRLALLSQNPAPIATQEKILSSPQGEGGLYLYQLYQKKNLLPELADLSTPPEKLSGQFFIKLGFKPGPGFEELLLFTRELQWQGVGLPELRKRLITEFPDRDYSGKITQLFINPARKTDNS